jgi:endoglucanase
MIAAHMDEVGMMLTNEDEEGIYRFEAVGGLDARWLAGKAVLVGKDQLTGVIGFKPIHLSSKEEIQQAVKISQLRIDIGQENGKRAKIGDRATFATRFMRSGSSIYAKALDDRVGVASLIELFKHAPANIDLLAAFTVQEEVGLRGAQVAAYRFNPQLAIVLDCTPANDMPAWDRGRCVGEDCYENTRYNTRLGLGPAIYIADRATLSDPRLVRFLAQTADEAGIPYQFRQPGGGGTDAGAIHKQRAGIPSISVSVPGRYLHTPVSMIRLDDWKNTLALIYTALEKIAPEILSAER